MKVKKRGGGGGGGGGRGKGGDEEGEGGESERKGGQKKHTERKGEEDHLGYHVQEVHRSRVKDEPQYLIESDTTDHLAMHKGSALKKIRKSKRAG